MIEVEGGGSDAVGPVTYTADKDAMKASRTTSMIAVLGSNKIISDVHSAENYFFMVFWNVTTCNVLDAHKSLLESFGLHLEVLKPSYRRYCLSACR